MSCQFAATKEEYVNWIIGRLEHQQSRRIWSVMTTTPLELKNDLGSQLDLPGWSRGGI